jgi:hypothetical protein
LEAMGQGGEPAGGIDYFGALQHSPSPFGVWTGRRASGQRQVASADRPIPLSSCSNTPSPFERPGAMGASWQTGSR